jgi:hypothetical protein
MNPSRPSVEESEKLSEKYGLIVAAELEDMEIGPYCDGTSCEIPYGVGVGNRDTPVYVHVGMRNGLVIAIDVIYAEAHWGEILPILDQKYGRDWKTESHEDVITNYRTKKSTHKTIVEMHHISDGLNTVTGYRCKLWAKNFDITYEHQDAYSRYHSVFEIKLISNNF